MGIQSKSVSTRSSLRPANVFRTASDWSIGVKCLQFGPDVRNVEPLIHDYFNASVDLVVFQSYVVCELPKTATDRKNCVLGSQVFKELPFSRNVHDVAVDGADETDETSRFETRTIRNER